MGTRHLIGIQKNDKYILSQYGQWDGYLDGQGLDILNFLKDNDLSLFYEKTENLKHCTAEEINLNYSHKQLPLSLSRDCGSDILDIIYRSESEVETYLNEEFGYESLFCEYAYVINLDSGEFEVYIGFNTEPLKKDERFYKDDPDESGYYGCKILGRFKLTELPNEDEFLSLMPKDEYE